MARHNRSITRRTRRELLQDVGRGMLVAGLGATTALDLGLTPALADDTAADAADRLTFGDLEPLVALMQETPAEKLLPITVEKLRAGTSLQTLVTAAALANARAFGGNDYTGYHTFMALLPAYQMAAELPADRRALPVLKVIYRNAQRIEHESAHHTDTLHPIDPAAHASNHPDLHAAVRAADWDASESTFARLATGPLGEAYNHLQFAVQDEVDVHRVVLSWRAWAMLDLTGDEYAHTLLRQSVRYCVDTEQRMHDRGYERSAIREVLPRLLDEHHLLAKPLGTRQPDDAWVEHLARTILFADRPQAAEAVAAALAEGFQPEAVGEAISLAANLLVIHDRGREAQYATDNKPPGCVHGDSVGVHASDSANAWRNIARVSNHRNAVASLIVGAFHTAGQSHRITKEPYPYAHLIESLDATDGDALRQSLREAITVNDQARACAVVDRYGQLDLPLRDLLDVMLAYAVSEDGALHAEKYYRTVVEEFAATRPAYRWRQIIALARVTASEYGYPAPGYDQACDLLAVT